LACILGVFRARTDPGPTQERARIDLNAARTGPGSRQDALRNDSGRLRNDSGTTQELIGFGAWFFAQMHRLAVLRRAVHAAYVDVRYYEITC
jgi:hypothetical protein